MYQVPPREKAIRVSLAMNMALDSRSVVRVNWAVLPCAESKRKRSPFWLRRRLDPSAFQSPRAVK
jgi:hypothetical protein